MNKLTPIFAAVSTLLFLTKCQPEPLDITLPQYEPEIVVASQVIPDEIMFIGLTRSFTVLSSDGSNGSGDSSTFLGILVDSALVTIEYSGLKDTLFKIAPGLFASLTTLDNPGTNYTLNVKDYLLNKTVYANSEMLTKIKFDSIFPIINTSEIDTTVSIHVEFTDNTNEQNHYMINVYSREIINLGLDLNSFFNNGENKIRSTVLFDDKDLIGDKYSFDIKIDNIEISDSIAISLSSISQDYYEFLKKREKSGNIFTEITNEPINYPSNIKGGLGFFNTHSPDIKYFDLNKY
tara:strand:+ start:882 stop:1757 length:876 start_codon:yes stop_codon:yes gene_type:complete